MTVERDDAERLSAVEDQAARTADLFLGGALRAHQLRAGREGGGTPGVCSNCQAACLPAAVYCDSACRDDHEARVRTTARTRADIG